MRRAWQVPVALAAAALLIMCFAGSALSHDASYASHVSINTPDQTIYRGHVRSPLHGCESQRTVKLYQANGTPIGFSDVTDSEGRYEMDTGPGTRYYARATRKVIDRPGHHHVCKPANSPTI